MGGWFFRLEWPVWLNGRNGSSELDGRFGCRGVRTLQVEWLYQVGRVGWDDCGGRLWVGLHYLPGMALCRYGGRFSINASSRYGFVCQLD
ncbi:hypothetical protein Nepgr_018520 [Nepenthes gracilis]|uniref:Uncharacterized protein n=1 Tax=Nepenthes gracilis TaxID=150966 RepID=A0AAD3XU36_NEPGR|nr:hypothetical protein Nepgr_018520 [Nepenthes gracilis]